MIPVADCLREALNCVKPSLRCTYRARCAAPQQKYGHGTPQFTDLDTCDYLSDATAIRILSSAAPGARELKHFDPLVGALQDSTATASSGIHAGNSERYRFNARYGGSQQHIVLTAALGGAGKCGGADCVEFGGEYWAITLERS